MPAITPTQLDLAAIRLGNELFVKPNRLARFDTDSLRSIITNIDTVMIANGSLLPPSVDVETTLWDQMKLIEADLSVSEASRAIQVWAIDKYGIDPL